MQNRLAATVVIALAVMAGAWLWFEQSRTPPSSGNGGAGQRLFPELEQQLNSVTRIRVERGGNVYEVVKTGDQWQLPDKGGYPALFGRVKSLLLGVSLLVKFEPKTNKPENHIRLGVQEPTAESDNMRISLHTDDGHAVASLIIGAIRNGLVAGGRDGIFARVSGDPQAWLLAGKLDLPLQQLDWIDRQIVHIKPKAVKRVTISHPDGTSLQMEKPRKSAFNFSVMNMPTGGEKIDPAQLSLLARGLTALKMDDVRVRTTAAPPETGAVTATFINWDGSGVKVTTIEQNHQVWAWFDLVEADTANTESLRTRFAGWIYRLPPSRASKLRVRLSDLGATGVAE